MNWHEAGVNVAYPVAALLIGLLWCAALMIPEATRNLILADHPVLHVALMCAVSVLVSLVFRGPIAKARTRLRFLVLAIFLPFAGAAIWFLLASLLGWLTQGRAIPFWELALTSVALLPTVLGAVALSAYYIIIPMGLLSQYVMHALSRVEGNEGHAGTAT